MKNVSHWVKFVLVLALAWMSVPVVKAATAAELWKKAGVPDIKQELSELGLGSLTYVQDGTVWSADARLLGRPPVRFYLYWVKVSNLSTPVLAVPLTGLTVGNLTQHLFVLNSIKELVYFRPMHEAINRTARISGGER